MKEFICTVFGIIGSGIATSFGGFDAGLTTLVMFMAIDYVSGLLVAGVFKNSTKTETGGLRSSTAWKGIFKKGMSIIYVVVATRIDLMLGTTYIRDAVIIAFIVNELISLVENAGLMGIPMPDVIKRSIDILQKKADTEREG